MSNMKNKMKRLWAILLSAAMIFTYMPAYMLSYAADEDQGAPGKSLKSNEDGTYKLELEVTGDASTTKKASNVNVLVVYDVSSSMTHHRTKSATGSMGNLNPTDWNSPYFNLYKRSNNNYVRISDAEEYTGTLYYYDEINRRYVEYTGERFSTALRADSGEKAVNGLAEELFKYQDPDNPSNIQMSVVTFCSGPKNTNGKTWVLQPWTSRKSDITDKFYSTGTSHHNMYDSGTNYEAALQQADDVLKGNNTDNDPTYVLFITDGQPSQSVTSGNHTNPTSPNPPYSGNNVETRLQLYRDALDETASIMTQLKTLGEGKYGFYGIYAFGNEDDFLDDLIYYANEGEERAVVTNKTDPTDHYYNAGDTAALDAAIAEIFSDIVSTLGVTDVSINDGTTNKVETTTGTMSELLDVDDQSFEYWLSLPVVNGQFKRTDPDTGEEVTYTISKNEDGTYKISWGDKSVDNLEGSFNSTNTEFKYKWTGSNAFYNKKPPAATFDDKTGAVNWNLAPVGTLLDDVTYSVTFDVYPSQYTYDTLAKLKNRDIEYSDLDDNEKKYLAADGQLKTNTTASYTYTDTREENPQPKTVTYKNPDPVKTVAYELEVQKNWPENKLDPDSHGAEPLTMTVTQDGNDFTTIELNEENSYTERAYISTGLMRVTYEDKEETVIKDVRILDEGHDYTFAEFDDVSYYWDLDVETVRPMLINSAETVSTLVKVEEGAQDILDEMGTRNWLQKDGKTYFKINDEAFELSKAADAGHLQASNERRSHLNLTKAVEGDAKGDETFTFDVNVNAAFNSHSISVDNSLLGGYSYKKLINGEEVTVNLEPAEGGLYKAQYTDASGNTVVLYGTVENNKFTYTEALWFSIWDPEQGGTVKGLEFEGWTEEEKSSGTTGYYYAPDGTPLTVELKAKQNLRFTNLPVGSTYTIEEKQDAMPADFEYKSAAVTPDSESAKIGDDGKIEGTIAESNVSYTAKYTNEYTKRILSVEKIWDDDNDQSKKRPASIQVQLKAGDTAVGDPVTLDESNEWKHTWTGLSADVEYTADETAVPDEYTREITEKADYSVTASNVPEGTETITVSLLKDGEATGDTIELTGSDWTGTFEDIEVGSYTVSTDTDGVELSTPAEKNRTVVITNSIIRKINIPFTKTWKGPKKDIRVNLLADGTKVASKELKVADEGTGEGKHSWDGVFEDQPIYNNDGSKITYTVTEEFLDTKETANYTTTIEAKDPDDASKGFAITNENTEKTKVTVEKKWDDDDDRDGLRPESIKVQLKADGADKDEFTLSEANSWKHEWNNLAKYNEDGSEIVYTVTEENPSYSTVIVTTETVEQETPAESTDAAEAAEPESTENEPQAAAPAEESADPVTEENKDVTEETPQETEEDPVVEEAPVVKEAPAPAKAADDADEGTSTETVTSTEEVEASYTTRITGDAASGYTIENEYTPEETSVSVTKAWDDDSDRDGLRPDSVTVQLYADGTPEGSSVTLSEDNKWTHTWDHLKVNKKTAEGTQKIVYTVDETPVPAGYTKTVTGDAAKGFTITNKHDPETITIKVSKKWSDNEDQDGKRPDNITVMLSAGSAAESQTEELNAENGWSYTWTGLNKKYKGADITYTVDEPTVPDGYRKNVPAEMTEVKDSSGKVIRYEIEIENIHDPEKTNVEGTKIWQDDGASDRPTDITIDILAKAGQEAARVVDTVKVIINGEPGEGEIKATQTDDNTWTFSTEKKYDAYSEGTKIVYSIAEHAVDGYISTRGDGNTITNTKLIDVSVVKVWDDDEDRDGIRPDSLTVSLMAGDEAATDEEGNPQTVTLTEDNDWSGEITGLPMYVDGEKVEYTWDEGDLPEGYTLTDTSVEGTVTTLTNSHTPETTQASVRKVWSDADDQDGIRPDSLTVTLSNGTEVTLNEENGWEATVENLPKYSAGEEIEYTWTEGDLPEGYTLTDTSVEGTVTTLTNSHTPETTEASVRKVWSDADDQDGIRPDSLTVTLSNGTKVTLNEDNGWAAKVENLPKYKDHGTEIEYTWSESDLPEGYTLSDTSKSGTVTTLTNSHTPETTEASVKKVWDDADDQDGKRPDSLTVTLSNGTEVTLNEENGWEAKVENLPKYKDHGTEIEYTWEESSVPEGYELSGTSTEGTLTTLTNSHTPETTEASVKKVWDDADDQDGIRPDSLTVKLSDGTEVTLNEENGWEAKVEDLPKYKDHGTEIKYTWSEVDLPEGYTLSDTSKSGTVTTLTNTHTPETTEASVRKVWDDADDQDGKRPDSLTVTLSDGTEVTLNEGNDWQATVKDLPKYENHGEEIEYTWEESSVPEGYELSGTSTEGTLTTLTNTYDPELTSATVKKIWDDKDDKAGKRPDSLTVILSDGTEVILNEDNDWQATVEDLPKYADGKEIEYTWEEGDMPKGYELTYTAKNGTITVLTNTYNEGVVVKTGDDTRIVAVAAVFLGSLLAFIILLLYRRRQQA